MNMLCVTVAESPSQRNPQSSSIKQLKQIVHELAETTERDGDGHVTVGSNSTNKKEINTHKSPQIVTCCEAF